MPHTKEEMDGLWRKIVEIHNHTKLHLLYCEESEVTHVTFLQPRNELCNALEHIVREKAHELGLGNADAELGEDYEYDTLDKALGHEFRAFFDVCDWLSIVLREGIRSELDKYTPGVIQTVIPNYYTEIRPMLDVIPDQIAAIRARKDIKGDILAEVNEYNNILLELKAFRVSLSAKIPLLEEVKGGFNICEEILHDLKDYAPGVIQQVIPDYYPKIRPQIEALAKRITAVEIRKDIKGDVIGEALECSTMLLELRSFHASLPAKIVSLEEVKKGEGHKRIWEIVIGLFLVLIGAATYWAWDKTH